MATKSVAQYLEFANLQIAAETFYGRINDIPNWTVGDNGNLKYKNLIDITSLKDGNNHTSKFTPTLAAEFIQKWKMVAHIANTGRGFPAPCLKRLTISPARRSKKAI